MSMSSISDYIQREKERIDELVARIPIHHEYKEVMENGKLKRYQICCVCKGFSNMRYYRTHSIHAECEKDEYKCPYDALSIEINKKYE